MPSLQSLLCSLLPFFCPVVRSACNADNCLRAIRGTTIPERPAEGSVDCSSFLLATVTPAAVTSTTQMTTTSTATIYSTSTVYSVYTTATTPPSGPPPLSLPPLGFVEDLAAKATAVGRRRAITVSPSSIPSYASACLDAAQYSSACECIGVTARTTTVKTPTTTSTRTMTATTTVTSVVTATSTVCEPPTYGYAYSGGSTGAGPGQEGLNLTYPFLPSITSLGACCAECFATQGCVLYYMYDGGCGLYMTNNGTAPDADDQCPNGYVSEETEDGEAFGFGPCVYQ